ncbi:hypothetical protein AtubIFM56815_009353 [Aspergillus tubingensis]|nr:short-chain dehydrogenase [Aspergillus tubingensis]GFN11811.1 short-chain dehydrogenase [Aspergillus tubingensis]GLA85126.1 hypothetical protein AtubIFM56815_009353 [Aspergillus tubingensis]
MGPVPIVLITGILLMPQKSTALVSSRAKIGANRGLGFATAKELLSTTNFHIIVGSRHSSNGNLAIQALRALPGIQGTVSTVTLDVTSGTSIEAARSQIETDFGRLDILVHNAGIYHLPSKPSVSHVDGKILDSTLEANVKGPARVTKAFLPLLLRHRPSTDVSSPPRIVFVSSSMGSLSHNMNRNSSGTHAIEYRISKTALHMLLVEYHMALTGVTVVGSTLGSAPRILSETRKRCKRWGQWSLA